jgi:hypothetical protein
MRKLLSFLIALAAIVFGVCSPLSAQTFYTLGAGSVAKAASGFNPSCSQSSNFLARATGIGSGFSYVQNFDAPKVPFMGLGPSSTAEAWFACLAKTSLT